MFEAGALIYRIQAVGAKVFAQELSEADRAAKAAATGTKQAGQAVDAFGRQLDRARPSVKQIAAEIRGMSQEAQQAAREVGMPIAAVGAAMVAVAGLAVKAATDWESAWAGVRKTVDGTDEELAAVEAGLRDLARELPASHIEIAAVAEAAGQLGVKTKDIVAFTRTMVDLGETTNLTADEAATSLAQLMNIMQTAPEDVGRLGAAVVALGNNGASTERDIVQMAQRIAGAAKIIGLTEGETLGLANALASVGIEVEAGGTAISRIMIDIAKAVSEGGEGLQEWADVAGVSADEFAAKFKASPAEALAIVVEGMGELDARGGDVFAMLERLGQSDVRVTRALLNLANSGDNLRRSLTLGNRAWGENLALQEEAEKRYATAASKIQVAQNATYDMAIELGDHLIPFVVGAAEGIKTLSEFVGGLPDPVQGGVAVIGALTGVILVLGGVALLAVPKIVQFRTSLATLAAQMPLTAAAARSLGGFLAGPWGVALALASAGALMLSNHLDSLKASSKEAQASLSATFGSGESILATFNKGGLNELFPGMKTQLSDIRDLINDITTADWSLRDMSVSPQRLDRTRETLRRIGDELATLAQNDLPAAHRAFMDLAEGTDGSDESLAALLNTMPAYKSELIAAATEAGVYNEAMTEARKNQVLLEFAQREGVAVTESAAAAYVEAAQEVRNLEGDLEDLLDVINEANHTGQDAVTANLEYRQSLADIDEVIKRGREGQKGFVNTLNRSTEAGRENWEMLIELAEKAEENAQAQYDLEIKTLGAEEATRKFQERLEKSQQAILDRAKGLGATNEQLEFIKENIFSIPDETEWELILEIAKAQTGLDDFIKKNDGRTVRLGVGIYANKQVPLADGRFNPKANGDFAPRMSQQTAQMQRAGSYVIWAEDETEGETFIPHAPSKRKQAEEYLAQTAELFGGVYLPAGRRMADGDLRRGQAGSGLPPKFEIEGRLDLGDGLEARIVGTVKDVIRGAQN